MPYALKNRRVREIFKNNFDGSAMLTEAQFLGVMKEAQTQGSNSFSGTLERARYPARGSQLLYSRESDRRLPTKLVLETQSMVLLQKSKLDICSVEILHSSNRPHKSPRALRGKITVFHKHERTIRF